MFMYSVNELDAGDLDMDRSASQEVRDGRGFAHPNPAFDTQLPCITFMQKRRLPGYNADTLKRVGGGVSVGLFTTAHASFGPMRQPHISIEIGARNETSGLIIDSIICPLENLHEPVTVSRVPTTNTELLDALFYLGRVDTTKLSADAHPPNYDTVFKEFAATHGLDLAKASPDQLIPAFCPYLIKVQFSISEEKTTIKHLVNTRCNLALRALHARAMAAMMNPVDCLVHEVRQKLLFTLYFPASTTDDYFAYWQHMSQKITEIQPNKDVPASTFTGAGTYAKAESEAIDSMNNLGLTDSAPLVSMFSSLSSLSTVT
ncbi:hypothetical protein CDD83_4445 [Cordyceps sp. RAO-2017]|nr:hypothetical protein CDD83_4445 [Cordyceps sp. RAO-2017]